MAHGLWTRIRAAGDRGTAMLLTMSVMMLVTTLAGVGTTMAVRDMRGAGQAQQAGSALDAAEAGLAQAVAFIRSNGTRKLACNLTTCQSNAWSQANPVAADVKGGGRWNAWIKPVSVGNGDDGDRYLVHSVGTAGGPAERIIEVEVAVTPIDLPKGIFGRTINLGGNVILDQISVFTTGCVYKRDKLNTDDPDLDLAYGVPIGVHSSQIITESQGSGQYCPNTAKPIHVGLSGLSGLIGSSGLSGLLSANPCHVKYPHDQDRLGGTLTGLLGLCGANATRTPYLPRDLDGDLVADVNGSFLRNDQALFKSFGIKRPALTDSEIEQLKTTAQAQGTYYTSPTNWAVPNGVTNPHTVLFFDLAANQTVDLKPLDDSLWARGKVPNPLSALCLDASLLIVVQGGNARLNGNLELAASVYLSGAAPGGQFFKADGTAKHIGMLYGDTVDMTGTLDVSLDACYVANPPPALFDVNPGTYRELDR